MYYGFYGPYPFLLLVSILLSLYASMKVQSNYRKYSHIYNKTGMTGFIAARKILDANGLYDVRVEMYPGNLSDHYDPMKRVVRLSQGVYESNSLAAVSVAAHEIGHAIQHKESYMFLQLRNAIARPVGFASNISWVLIVIGIILSTGSSNYQLGGMILDIGILMFFFVVLFHLITLPVELDASKRALVQMKELGIIFDDEAYGAKKMLGAAAMTYVAALAVSIIQLLRLLAIRNRD